MKIRINGNSIRYRLNKLDLSLLKETQNIVSTTHIGGGTLHFCLKGNDIYDPIIKMENNSVHLFVPLSLLTTWYAEDQVGFEFVLTNPDGSKLTIQVEKDFRCLTERSEDESQSFDNPMAGQNC